MKIIIKNFKNNFMKISKSLMFLFFFITGSMFIQAQSISAVAGVSENKGIIVRWFAQEPFNVEGVNVYRKEKKEDAWTKLNQAPIKRMEKVDEKSTDEEMKMYSALITENPLKPEDAENWRLMQITKGILDEKYSRLYGMQYDDNSAEQGKTYEYKVIRVAGGKETEGIISNAVKYEKFIPSPAPQKFAAYQENRSVNFNWKTDKKKYFVFNIFRSETENGEKTKINSLPVFVFSFKDKSGVSNEPKYFHNDSTVIPGKTYYYTLEGIDFLGRKTEMTSSVKISIKSLVLPAAPYNVRGKVVDNKVTITWKEISNKDLKEFNIYRSVKKDSLYKRINAKALSVTDTSYTDIIQTPEPAYYYYVEAKNNVDNTINSPYVFVPVPDMTPPSIPLEVKGSGEVGRILLSWKMGIDKNLKGYYIYRAISEQPDEFLLLTPYPVTKNEYIDTLTKENQNYFLYQVKAVSKNYVTSLASTIIKVKLKDITPPTAPIISNIYGEDGKVFIRWRANIEEDLSGYDIYRSAAPDTSKMVRINRLIPDKNFNLYKDSVVGGAAYYYCLTASDTNGNTSAKSNVVSFIAVNTDTILQEPDGIKGIYDAETKMIKLSWNYINNEKLIGYVVFRVEEEGRTAISDMMKDSNFNDIEPLNKKNVYVVLAYDSNGNVSESKPFVFEIVK